MSFRFTYLTFLLCLASSLACAQYQYVPTTTIAAEEGNNTSANSAWMTTYQPTATSQNVSKQPTRSLLYPNATTNIYAALMVWFGKSSHINVGYNSQDPTQIDKQITDMQSRGIDGAIIAWYGPDSYENSSTLAFNHEAQTHNNFKFAIMIDQGAIQWDSCSGCDATHALIYDLNYIANTYYSSPSYLTIGGRPVIVEFGLQSLNIDWNLVRSSINGNPLLIFRNAGGFTFTQTNGAYAWVEPTQATSTDPMDLAYLDYFYSKAMNYLSTEVVMGSGYPGFNDKLASWGQNRYITQACGQTWLDTIAEADKYFSSTKQLSNLQVVTWNDYEEGTAIEAGIDNCFSVASSLSGNTLSWSPTGQENTLSDYTVFVSQDETNAAVLAKMPTTTHALDLSTYNFPAGTWYFYVRATAKSTLQNHFAPPVSLTIAPPPTITSVSPTSGAPGTAVTISGTSFGAAQGNNYAAFTGANAYAVTSWSNTSIVVPVPSTAASGSIAVSVNGILTNAVSFTVLPPAPPPADFTMATNPTSVSIHNGQSTTTTVTVTQTGTLGAPVSFSCANLPSKLSCSFSPSSVAAGTPSATSTLTITARSNAAALTPPLHNGGGIAIAAAMLLPVFLLVRRHALRGKLVMLMMVVCFCALGLTACGGSMQASSLTSSATTSSGTNSPSSTSQTQTYTITVVGTSGTIQHSVQETVVVN
jgi:IPT/TIG domain-containing protein